MKKTLLVLIAASVISLLAADSPADSKQMEGTWKPSSAELAGTPLPPPVLKAITLKIVGETYEVTVAGEPRPDQGFCKINPAASPKTMTITSTNGPNKGKTFPAIYEVKDGALRVCYDLSGAKHPTEFKTTPGTMLYLVAYERQK